MKIKTFVNIIGILLFPMCLVAQNTFKNTGNLKVFGEAKIGFHTNLINEGVFDENLGLVGFYSDESLSISGIFSPVFYDFETVVEKDLILQVPVSIKNSLNFIYGNINTPKNDKNVYLNLLDDALYNGQSNSSKLDGYLNISNQKEFTFPIGNSKFLRPLHLSFINESNLSKSAYFFENPKTYINSTTNLDTDKKHITLGQIGEVEFWNLESSGLVRISLTWNSNSNIKSLVKNIEDLTVVGWNNQSLEWDNLGNTFVEGDLNNGNIASEQFEAENYEILSLGSLFKLKLPELGNYLLTPDGDGINDTLFLELTEQSPNNTLQIYNRSGRLIYEIKNYRNQFNGIPNKSYFGKETTLTEGVYFYIMELEDLGYEHQGFFYLKI